MRIALADGVYFFHSRLSNYSLFALYLVKGVSKKKKRNSSMWYDQRVHEALDWKITEECYKMQATLL